MILPILPAEVRTPLDDAGTAFAVWKPLDVEEHARWFDAFPTDADRNTAAVSLVRQRLLRLEGVEMRDASGGAVPYDHATHFVQLPAWLVTKVYAAILDRTRLGEGPERD